MLKTILEEIFNQLDLDGSGTLEKDEVREYAEMM